jgi:hypothetical protein
MKTVNVYEHATGTKLDTIREKDFGKWCETHGWLPHHKVSGGWVVIK